MIFSRRNFLSMGVVATCVLATLQWWIYPKSKKIKTGKFLNHDGKLVEVDFKNIPLSRKTASKQQFVSWIWKDQKL